MSIYEKSGSAVIGGATATPSGPRPVGGLVVTDLAKKRAYQRAWRAENPERVAGYNEARRIPPTSLVCVECGGSFLGRKDRLLCSRRCKDRRHARLHPEALREKKRRREH
jgi:hypothetical protein